MQEFNQAECRLPTSGRGKGKRVWNLFATFWRSETRVLAAVGLQSSDTKRVATSKQKARSLIIDADDCREGERAINLRAALAKGNRRRWLA